ncbi:MAG TPA: glycosyltransferase [Gemmatimonadales bacterium]|nr:glycosyltransferase [Gemmatimonadales bacterium]
MTSSAATAVVPGLVSVITPCYNAAPFVGETLAAVRAQTYAPVEHIVVDDGSRDESWAVIAAAGRRPAPLRAVRLAQNGGASHARNVGAALARGEYLMFLDADDLLAPDTLAALVAAVRDRPGSMGVCSWQRLRRSREGAWVLVAPEAPLPVPGADHIREYLTAMCVGWVPPCAILWRRDAYARTGGWDESLSSGDDTDLLLRAMLDDVQIALATGGEAHYRQHGSDRLSLSADVFSIDRLESRFRTLDKFSAQLEVRGTVGAYAMPLGVVYQEQARLCYQQGFVKLGRQFQVRGEQLANGPRLVPRSRAGRVLYRALGLERKERMMQTLAAWGLGSRERRERARYRAVRNLRE